ncbi:MAG: ATP synthase F1 subunit epsilon [Bacteroidetes bacterium GWC2_33_15]|nr:MAG: ATP synthase F1 subunit epsilon [Bacteroidetes bacterium GWA2_33_15]OFX50867.1 MAG: ATP synthase F1 subunit epsilon [Bacteroidetes bacterium GWC2_33_15]OFX62850.1 MAG: ATP synthase F1 subunit epsilon [Bacteroidetes bacterium GWB2_32_14]OFX69920.1 MAG: ATP synthase F1 subunit epsilon [Bacteroidetes bacterium GWD2_33_33]HAN18912.1 ATP synthase F1 subunit epsilon [Bacteroidales bacterium]
MFLEIITPDKKVYSGKVNVVQVPGSKGLFEVLEYHAPIISTLEKGRVKIVEGNTELFFNINGGIIEVKGNNVIILAESIV